MKLFRGIAVLTGAEWRTMLSHFGRPVDLSSDAHEFLPISINIISVAGHATEMIFREVQQAGFWSGVTTHPSKVMPIFGFTALLLIWMLPRKAPAVVCVVTVREILQALVFSTAPDGGHTLATFWGFPFRSKLLS